MCFYKDEDFQIELTEKNFLKRTFVVNLIKIVKLYDSQHDYLKSKLRFGAGAMSHWLRELVALVQDAGLIPSTHRTAHNHL